MEFLRPYWKRFLQNSAFGILGLPMAVLWISALSLLLGLSAGLLIIGIGFVILALTLRFATAGASAERWLLREILHVDIPEPTLRPASQLRRSALLNPLEDPVRWRCLSYLALRMFLGVANAGAVIVIWIFPVVAFIAAVAMLVTDGSPVSEVSIPLILGTFFVVFGPVIIHGFAQAHIHLARSLLGPGREQLIVEADTAVRHRDLSVGAAEAERRRIERDLHDGAQARLATVALDLGRAKRKLEKDDVDPEVAAIIDGAHRDAKEAIVELRNLARGIHPAVLADRGLDAALSEVAARCEVPVHLDVKLHSRPPAHIESAAYFAASELVANITKHSRAQHAWVTVRSDDESVYLDVSDDGVGGADPALGSGLDGLHDRIAGLDGELSVRSPLGGGTSVMVELPLARIDR